LLGRHNGVEAGGQKGRGSDDESSGAQLPKSKASVRKEVDSEEHHSAADADLLIAKEGMQMQVNDPLLSRRDAGLAAPWCRRGGTSMESLIPCSHEGRALVVKGAEEKFNGSEKANHSSYLNTRSANTSSASEVMGETKYLNPLNSRRGAKPSNIAFSTSNIMGEVKYLSSLTYSVEELCISSRSGHPGLAFRGMANPLRKRHHEDKQATKNT
ncbi:hypothetical protein B296_00058896, partial [Ensete ventricosum]